MALAAQNLVRMGQNETKNAAVDFTGQLRSGESISSVTSVTISPSGPTISNSAVSGSSMEINGVDVDAGKAITFRITGAAATKGLYTLTATVATSSSQVLVSLLPLKVE